MLLMLSATSEAIRRGRSFAVRCAREMGADAPTLAVVELLASELVTNAVKFGGPKGAVALRVFPDDGLLRIEVSDDSDVDPLIDVDRPAHLGGHGMKLVALLAADWGVRHHQGTYGKTVWMTLPMDRDLSVPPPDPSGPRPGSLPDSPQGALPGARPGDALGVPGDATPDPLLGR